jgi:hypothetical protein
MTTNRHVLLWVFLGISGPQICFAQFSPGELSHGHEQLSGMENCTQCHEVARTISNKKCLSCHKDVKAAVDARRGLHSSVTAQQCSACHKEHKGRDARITLIDPKGFDHNVTGFVRTGKHASTDCANCHNRKNIRNPALLAIIAAEGHDTYRGLTRMCVSCHEDKHDNTVGKECQNCHEPSGWSPAKLYDHSTARFKLVGKHTIVECKKCHTGIALKQSGKPLFFTANNHDDCTPCHVSPHRKQFSPNACASCHSPEDWMIPQPGMKLNHDATGFSLEGR